MSIELEIVYFRSEFMEKYSFFTIDKMLYFGSQTSLNFPDLVSNPFCLHKIDG